MRAAGFTLGKGSFDEVNRLGGSSPDSVFVTRYRAERPERRIIEPAPADLYMTAIHLRPCGARRQWLDGRLIPRPASSVGGFSLLDMRREWRSEIVDSFETVNFTVPVAAFDRLAEEAGVPRLGAIEFSDWTHTDPVMLHLAMALRPALLNPEQAATLFVDQMLAAAATHLAVTYGGLAPRRRPQAGLASWQERRVREMIEADPGRDLSLSELAEACDLSAGHFARAFKQSMGRTPHRWLIEQRVARARLLLADTAMDLAAIALETGFSDQSHFTRVFSAHAGVTPGAWRRLRRR